MNTTAVPASRLPQSTAALPAAARAELQHILRELGIKSLVEIQCGAGSAAARLDAPLERYVGVDADADIIRANLLHGGEPQATFLHADASRDPLPQADAILCRDHLLHLPAHLIQQNLANFRRSGGRYLIMTSFTGRADNADVHQRGWRPLNFQLPPLALAAPLHIVRERAPDAADPYNDKSLLVLDLQALDLSALRGARGEALHGKRPPAHPAGHSAPLTLSSSGAWSEHVFILERTFSPRFKGDFRFAPEGCSGAGELQVLLFSGDRREEFLWFSLYRGPFAGFAKKTIEASWLRAVGNITIERCDRVLLRVKADDGATATLTLTGHEFYAQVFDPDLTAPVPRGARPLSNLQLFQNEQRNQRRQRAAWDTDAPGPSRGILGLLPSLGPVGGGQALRLQLLAPEHVEPTPGARLRVRFAGWSAHAEVDATVLDIAPGRRLTVGCVTPLMPIGRSVRRAILADDHAYPSTVDVSVVFGEEVVGGGSYLYSDHLPADGDPVLLYPGCEEDILKGWICLDRRPVLTPQGRTALWEFHQGLRCMADGTVDAITISHMLMYMPVSQHGDFFADCFRALKRGGVLRITEDNVNLRQADDSHYLIGPTNPVQMRQALAAQGFEVFDQYPHTSKSPHEGIKRQRHMDLWNDEEFADLGETAIYFIEGVKPMRHYSLGTCTLRDPFSSELQQLFDGRQLAPALIAAQVSDHKSSFIADPFLCRWEGEDYVFFESRASQRAHIAVARRDGEQWRYLGIALDEPFHLSFPLVFTDGGRVYMMPESGAANEIRLYQPSGFPLRWEHTAVLLKGRAYADNQIFQRDGTWWLLTFVDKQLELYFADALTGPFQPHPANPIVTDPHHARPAGRVHQTADGKTYRFSQNCARFYGENLALHEITTLTREHYAERPVADPYLRGPDVATATHWNTKTHHIDFIPAQDGVGWLTIFDATDTR